MDEGGALRLAIDTAHQVASDELDEQSFADRLLRTFDANAGVGFSTWTPTETPTPRIVSAGGPLMTADQALRAAPFADHHPGFVGMRRAGTSEAVRVSNEVALRRFWGTDAWETMHGHVEGRYPMGAVLFDDHHSTVFIGLHRRASDFTDEELLWLTRLQQPIAAAYRYKASVDRAVTRLSRLCGDEDRMGAAAATSNRALETPTRREAEVLALMAAGWTNIQIASRLHITERTVRKHLSAVYEKAHLSGRAAAATWWMRHRDDF